MLALIEHELSGVQYDITDAGHRRRVHHMPASHADHSSVSLRRRQSMHEGSEPLCRNSRSQ